MTPDLVQDLRRIACDLAVLSGDDPEALIRVGLELERVLDSWPSELQEAGSLLCLCLEGLQALYEGAVPQVPSLLEALREGVVAVERSLSAPSEEFGLDAGGPPVGHRWPSGGPGLCDTLPDAGRAIRSALGQEPTAFGGALGSGLWALGSDPGEAANHAALGFTVCTGSEPRAQSPEPRAASEASPAADEDLVRELLVECYENLDALDRDLVTLEQDPSDRQTLSAIFRTVHTIKGNSGLFGYQKLESLAHLGENLLSRLRDGELLLTSERTSALLAMVDAIREMLAAIETHGSEGAGDYSAVAQTLTALQQPDGDTVPSSFGELLIHQGLVRPEQIAAALAVQSEGDPRRLGEILVEQGAVRPQEVLETLWQQEETHASSLSESTVRVDVARLDRLMNLVGELVLARNQLLQLASTRRDPAFHASVQRVSLITSDLQEGIVKARMQPVGSLWSKLPRMARDLASDCGKQVRLEMEGQETELDRTIIEAIRDPLTHIVRNAIDHGIETPEVRIAQGKPAHGCLSLSARHESGQVVVEITDDGGGIDGERVKQRALETGQITPETAARMSERELMDLVFRPGLSTAAEVTRVSGRGVGMDVVKTHVEKIGGAVEIESAVGRGTSLRIRTPLTLAIIPSLIVGSDGDRYAIPQSSVLEIVREECVPGLPPIEFVHDAPVYRLRGSLLPLIDLAEELDPECEVRSAKCQVPSAKCEIAAEGQTDSQGGAFGHRSLSGATGSSSAPTSHFALRTSHSINIVVLQAGAGQFGLVVDRVYDSEEVVVKPLCGHLKSIPIFAGSTILGDGKVALILDVAGIGRRAAGRDTGDRERIADAASLENGSEAGLGFLLLALGDCGRAALPLSAVTRLVELPAADVEWSGGREVMQHHGEILPLIRLGSGQWPLAGGQSGNKVGSPSDPSGLPPSLATDRPPLATGQEGIRPGAQSLLVAVCSHGRRRVGLVVDGVLDIVEEREAVGSCLRHGSDSRMSGLLGSTVIQQRVTDVLDLNALVREPMLAGSDRVTK